MTIAPSVGGPAHTISMKGLTVIDTYETTGFTDQSKMDPTIKARWVAALRSGKYAQTNGTLARRDPDTLKPVAYCCLGVLCELAAEDGIVERVENVDAVETSSFLGQNGWPDHNVGMWATGTGPDVYGPDAMFNPTVDYKFHDDALGGTDGPMPYSLSSLNDQMGLSFNEIADLVEAQL